MQKKINKNSTKKPQANAAKNKRTAAEKSRPSTTRAGQSAPQKPAGKYNNKTNRPAADTEHLVISVNIKDHADKKGGHPHVILENIDDNHVSVGLTTRPKKGKNHPNYKLGTSPLGDGKTSYMRRQGTVAPINEYMNPRSAKMLPDDYQKAKEYGNKAKQKYLNNKKSNDVPNASEEKHQPDS